MRLDYYLVGKALTIYVLLHIWCTNATGRQHGDWDLSGKCCAPNHPRKHPCRHASILLPGTESWQRHCFWLVLLVLFQVTQADDFLGILLSRVFTISGFVCSLYKGDSTDSLHLSYRDALWHWRHSDYVFSESAASVVQRERMRALVMPMRNFSITANYAEWNFDW